MEHRAEKPNVTSIYSVMAHDTDKSKLHYEYGLGFIPYNQLIFILSGTDRVHYAGAEGVETVGSVRYLPRGNFPPEARYFVDILDPTTAGLCIDVYFDTDRVLSREMFITSFANDKTIQGLFEQIYQVWFQKRDGYYYRSMSILYEILERLDRAGASYLPRHKYEQIRPAVDYIDQNFRSGKISCTELAALCGISYSYLKRLFLERFEMTPSRYIMEKRVRYAGELILTKHHSVGEIALLSGFENVYYFSKVFKKVTGVPPSAYSPKVPRK